MGDRVQFKLETTWIPATVSFVGKKQIKVQYVNYDVTTGITQVYEADVHEPRYQDKIRLKEIGKARREDDDIEMEDRKEETEQGGSWYQVGVQALSEFISPKKIVKPLTFDEKAIADWSRNDVVSWMKSKSMSSYAQYADNVPKHMDGKELLDTNIDDLTLIIPKKLWRRRFMQQVELAKKKYVTTQTNAEDEDDQKAKAVNGIVGLNNLGMTCYMNTSIQIVSQSPYITRYLKKRAKMRSKASKSGRYPMLNAWTDLCDIIYNKKARRNHYTVTSPAAIRDALNEIDPEFGSGAQDDSSRSLGYMLQALDEEIDREIKSQKKTKKVDTQLQYKDNISIYHGRQLNDSESNNAIDELLQDYNPLNSIVRKTFDGIEHVIYECLECHHTFQQFSTFRIIDLTLVSHQVKVKNIYVVCGDKLCCIPEISMLDYCSMDLLQYYVTQYLAQNTAESITNYDCNIVIASANGQVHDVHNRKLSEVQGLNGVLFVLMNTDTASPNELGRILQVNLAGHTSQILSIKYGAYDANQIHKLAQTQITACRRHQQINGDKKKQVYYVNYNGNVFGAKELKDADSKFKQNMHNIDGINVLFVLSANANKSKYSYDINDCSLKICWDAEATCDSCASTLNALKRYKSMKVKRKQKWSKRDGYETIAEEVEGELDRIDKTIQTLQAKQNIVDVTNNFVHSYDGFSSTTYRELTDLLDCLEEYKTPKILDASCYGFPCSNCKPQASSLWVKVQKKIVHSPPIFLFHLDRYGKNTTVNHIKSRRNSYSGRYRRNNASDKFDHSVRYEMELQSAGGAYDLYGISNHSGTTSGGHYTATIKCLTDGTWYDISDSHVSSTRIHPLSCSKSATILAYVKK
eukprot:53805_1